MCQKSTNKTKQEELSHVKKQGDCKVKASQITVQQNIQMQSCHMLRFDLVLTSCLFLIQCRVTGSLLHLQVAYPKL